MARRPASDTRNRDFFCAVIIVGLLAGAAGLATTAVLRFVEHLTYHYTFGTLLVGIAGSSPFRRALGPAIGSALTHDQSTLDWPDAESSYLLTAHALV